MKEYLVLSHYSCSILEKAVNEHIEKGYQPLGGLSVIWRKKEEDKITNPEYDYYQAMILKVG